MRSGMSGDGSDSGWFLVPYFGFGECVRVYGEDEAYLFLDF